MKRSKKAVVGLLSILLGVMIGCSSPKTADVAENAMHVDRQTRDPIKDGRNWYAYCENNPLTWVDPEGLQAGMGPPPMPVPGP